jgi:hypothetical protein
MAIGTTNISTTVVGTTLSDSSHGVFALCTSANINKWSKYKPVIGTWPTATAGKYGLNLPTNWDYIPVTTGSPGRLGDYRGYEHDKDIAGPTVFIDNASSTLSGNKIPGIAGDGNLTGSVTFSMNTTDASVRITPTDLGYNNYYWGIKLELPGGGGTYYKTNTSVLSNGWVKTISVELTNLITPAFSDCPYAIGEFTWTTFISSTSASAWTGSAPSNIIYLPTGTYGSKTVINSGTFTVTNWLVADDISHTWLYSDYGYIREKSSVIHTNTGFGPWHVNSKPAWINFKVYDETDAMDQTGTPAYWVDQCILKMYPDAALTYPDAARSGFVMLGDGSIDMESIYVEQEAPPEIRTFTPSLWPGDTSGLTISAASGYVVVGSTTVFITYTPSISGTLYARIRYRAVEQGLGTTSGNTSGVSNSTNLTADNAAASGDLVTVQLSGDPIVL